MKGKGYSRHLLSRKHSEPIPPTLYMVSVSTTSTSLSASTPKPVAGSLFNVNDHDERWRKLLAADDFEESPNCILWGVQHEWEMDEEDAA